MICLEAFGPRYGQIVYGNATGRGVLVSASLSVGVELSVIHGRKVSDVTVARPVFEVQVKPSPLFRTKVVISGKEQVSCLLQRAHGLFRILLWRMRCFG